jgi:DNA modification methylase
MEFNQVKSVKIKDLKPHPKNPRVHPDSALDKLMKSIGQFGFTNPVLASKDGIILAGHARCKAAQKAGIEEVPVIFLDLEGADADAYLIADNKIQEETSWEKETLADLIKELQGLDYDVSFTGFSPPEIDELFTQLHAKDVNEDDFDVEEALKEPAMSKQGDLWLLGKHRLLCGDSTKAETYDVLMDGKKANLVVTDPPYNIDIQGGTKDKLKIKNDKMGDKEFYEFLLKFYKCTYDVMDDGAAIYVFHADTEGINFRTALKNAGFHLSAVCIWVKNSLVLSRSDFHFRHEPVLYAWKPTAKHKWYADRKQDTIWEYDRPKKSEAHPTMKPLQLVAYPIRNSSMTNCIVLDPFGGSGTTLIACEQADRVCYTIELDEKYSDVIVKRFIDNLGTDKDVFLIRDGKKIHYADVVLEVKD